MWMFLGFLIIFIYIIQKNYNRKHNNFLGKEVPKIPFLPVAWSILTGPHVEVLETIPDEYYQSGIYKARLGPNDYYTIVSADFARKLLTESEDVVPKYKFSSELPVLKFYGTGIVFSNGEQWRTHRKLSNPAFNRALSPKVMGDVVLESFKYLRKEIHQPVDIYELLQRITTEVLGQVAFGYSFGTLKSKELPDIVRKYKIIMTNVESYILYIFPFLNKLPTRKNKIFNSAVKDFDKFVFEIIDLKRIELAKRKKLNEKKKCNNEELLISMLEASEQENLNIGTKDLRDNIINFFSAGNDTTSMSVSSSIYYLAKYPHMQKRAREEVISIIGNELKIPTADQLKEMKYLNAVIKESLRRYPAPMTYRQLLKPTQFGEYVLPENSIIRVSNFAVHHDPKYWDNAYTFDPERWLTNEKRSNQYSYIPFSVGPRNCVGQNFSIMEQRIIIAMFLLKYEWSLPKNSIHKDELVLSNAFLFRPKNLEINIKERI
ncbi:cytochrome P450 [Rhizophagus irregularis]|uniref:Cytochrome P450 n=4 Tax=Rhizophagus irregularis TaxID=588596 RepID=A0A2I1EZ73_9GLOM|nr:cytochrome P450 [Rhizophagus irregularis DAOM 181602=DAOM 197198]EXX75053.1 Dit2p [Rhizophagus irregularis DAOM 197198w]PKC13067.1 cytochrome P450 [Rhizophagus irregularis]PKC60047.1 cytochrome P450 [Rhizophagus irregularis]PKY27424.1 cytochrome P450 [Rhizophagus irregularis]POG59532.1 cytochrome P450 [Rhizophagus irregularis DAOM 181602=DAOM 197198]|eukprot:XP_025166398.1 cytochrome P450 [Rhizophagus irregularis DAOM 181602=DAOM 197198]